jgi:hypothetical protein
LFVRGNISRQTSLANEGYLSHLAPSSESPVTTATLQKGSVTTLAPGMVQPTTCEESVAETLTSAGLSPVFDFQLSRGSTIGNELKDNFFQVHNQSGVRQSGLAGGEEKNQG